MLKTERQNPASMDTRVDISVAGETLTLFPEKVAYWKSMGTLFAADCHFGKIAHFRKSGIGLPTHAGMETFGQLHRLLLAIKPDRLVFLGDVFHSEKNEDFDRFAAWRREFPEIGFHLVLGNHDRATGPDLHHLGMEVYTDWVTGPFHCTHEPHLYSGRGFNLCGHLHPGVSLSVGFQHIKVPCFWKGKNHLCFPAFGTFTGSVAISPRTEDVLYAITGHRIRKLEAHILT